MSFLDMLFIGVITPAIVGVILMVVLKIDDRKVFSRPRKEPTLKLSKVKRTNWNGDYGQYK